MNGTSGLSISDRIRALAAEGRSRAEIARVVDRSYQQVRQVLVADEARARRNSQNASAVQPSAGVAEQGAAYQAKSPLLPVRLEVDRQGRVQLPRDWGLVPGSVFIARNFMGDIVLMSAVHASDAARVGDGTNSVVDDLIAERRWEAMREFNG